MNNSNPSGLWTLWKAGIGLDGVVDPWYGAEQVGEGSGSWPWFGAGTCLTEDLLQWPDAGERPAPLQEEGGVAPEHKLGARWTVLTQLEVQMALEEGLTDCRETYRLYS